MPQGCQGTPWAEGSIPSCWQAGCPSLGSHRALDGVDGLTVPIRGHVVVLQGQLQVTLKVCLYL